MHWHSRLFVVYSNQLLAEYKLNGVSQPFPLGSTLDSSSSSSSIYNILQYAKLCIIFYHLFVVYLKALFVAEITCCLILVCLLNHELLQVWKETDVNKFELLS
jgi:hypothetical protein